MSWSRTTKILAGVALITLIVVAIVFSLRYFDIRATQVLVVQRLEAITGREVVIDGDFDLATSLTPTLVAGGMKLANAPWGSDRPMLEAERVEIELQILPLLLRGDLLVDRLLLSGVDVLLETDAGGRANWRFQDAATEPPPADELQREFLLTEVSIQDGQVSWHDLASERTETVLVDRLVWQADSVSDELELEGVGQFDVAPFELSGRLGRLADLLGGEDPYPVALDLTLGDLGATIQGELYPGEGELELEVAAAGDQLAELGGLVGTELPELAAYQVRGTLTGSTQALALADLIGAIGADGGPAVRIVSGTVADLLDGAGVLVQLESSGDELAELAAALGIDMAPFGPYAAEATLSGDFDSLALRDLQATAGREATELTLTGSVGDVLEVSAIDLFATVEGNDLAALSPLARVSLPDSAPYRLAGHLSGSMTNLRIEDLQAKLPETVVRGGLTIDRAERPVPLIEGELVADRLDFDRMFAPPETDADGHDAAPAVENGPKNGLFPDEPLPLDWLDQLEADLVLRADQLRLDGLEFTDASANLVLLNGLLSVHDFMLHVAGGSIAAEASLEAEAPDDAESMAEVTVELSAKNIELGALLSGLSAPEKVVGEVAIDINVDTTGRSLEGLIESLSGNAAVVADGGEIYDAPLELLVTDLDILRALPPFWRDDDAIQVNCLITEFDIADGVARTEAMLDTQRMTLLGQGTVSLAEESLDLALRPVPKTQKLSTLAVPLDVTGSLRQPQVSPRKGTAVAQAVRGVLGGLLVPLNQLTALFGQEAADACTDALRQAQERQQAAGEPPEPSQ